MIYTYMTANIIQCIHGDIILNRSNNSVFLWQKSIEIGKPFISSAPGEFE